MACYDCDDCNYSKNRGGKCKRFEYTCPYNLVSFTDVNNVKNIHDNSKQIEILINKIENFDTEGILADEISNIKNSLLDIIEFSSETFIEEWKQISK